MPTLIVQRAVPFVRGDESIRIKLDGIDIGMLPAQEPLIREVTAGTHKVQAWMNGGTGRKITIQVEEGSTVTIRLSGMKVPRRSATWDWVILMLIFIIPGDALSGVWFWIAMVVSAALVTYSFIGLRRRMRDFLKLEIASGSVAEAV